MELEMLIQEYLFDCRARELSLRTIHGYEKLLRYFLEYANNVINIHMLQELKPIHIKQYIVSLQKRGCKPSYINDVIKPVKTLCSYAYQEGYTDELITKRVRNVKQPKVLIHTFSTDETKRMIDYFDGKDYLSVRNRLILMMLFDTGVRISELMEMKRHQIRDGVIIIYGKGRKERSVPLNPEVAKQIMKYDAARDLYFTYRQAQEYYFLSKNGKRLTHESVNKFMKTAAEAIGVNPHVRVSPHTCRHTFVHQSLKNGLDLYSLSRILGHESVSITQRYLEGIRDSQVIDSARKAGVLAHL